MARRTVSRVAGSLTASFLTACSPASLLGWVQPAAPGGEVRDIPYAQGPRHALDLYMPAASAVAPPVVVFFYGGGWTSGDRAMYRFVGRGLAACGAMTVIPDYRVWPDTGFPGFLRDASALRIALSYREAAPGAAGSIHRTPGRAGPRAD